eukprot:g24098.t1
MPDRHGVLQALRELPLDEQHKVLEELLSLKPLGAALEAWCDQDFSPCGSADRPRGRSWAVPLHWTGAVSEQNVTGCPWCRRPVAIAAQLAMDVPARDGNRYAYATLLYGPACHKYFLGALVLGEGLQRYGSGITALLMHTPDVPKRYLEALSAAGWLCREVEYLSKVAWALFKNWQTSRFIDVFTKLRVLEQEDFDKVLFLDLDLLVRDGGESLAKLFHLRPPAAMKRGPPIPSHGDPVPYGLIWGHPTRRQGDELPQHQQASGINAGVMLLQPSKSVLHEMMSEVHDYDHPQHYGTYMPEQESCLADARETAFGKIKAFNGSLVARWEKTDVEDDEVQGGGEISNANDDAEEDTNTSTSSRSNHVKASRRGRRRRKTRGRSHHRRCRRRRRLKRRLSSSIRPRARLTKRLRMNSQEHQAQNTEKNVGRSQREVYVDFQRLYPDLQDPVFKVHFPGKGCCASGPRAEFASLFVFVEFVDRRLARTALQMSGIRICGRSVRIGPAGGLDAEGHYKTVRQHRHSPQPFAALLGEMLDVEPLRAKEELPMSGGPGTQMLLNVWIGSIPMRICRDELRTAGDGTLESQLCVAVLQLPGVRERYPNLERPVASIRFSDCLRYAFVEAATELIASSMVAAKQMLGVSNRLTLENGLDIGTGWPASLLDAEKRAPPPLAADGSISKPGEEVTKPELPSVWEDDFLERMDCEIFMGGVSGLQVEDLWQKLTAVLTALPSYAAHFGDVSIPIVNIRKNAGGLFAFARLADPRLASTAVALGEMWVNGKKVVFKRPTNCMISHTSAPPLDLTPSLLPPPPPPAVDPEVPKEVEIPPTPPTAPIAHTLWVGNLPSRRVLLSSLEDEEANEKLLEAFDGKDFMGQPLEVNWSRKQQANPWRIRNRVIPIRVPKGLLQLLPDLPGAVASQQTGVCSFCS